MLIRQSQITTWLKQNRLAQQESDIRRVEGYIELSLFFSAEKLDPRLSHLHRLCRRLSCSNNAARER